MQITKQQKIIIGVFAVILAIFLIVKYNCEKVKQEVLEYGSGDKIEVSYLINSRIRNNCLHVDVIGPISKGTPFYRSEINFYVKDKNGTTLGKSIIKDDEIFNSRGKHITFSTIIPNVTWKDRLCGIDMGMLLPYMYYSKNYVNNDKSNLHLYYKKCIKQNKEYNRRISDSFKMSFFNRVLYSLGLLDLHKYAESFISKQCITLELVKHILNDDYFKSSKSKSDLDKRMQNKGLGGFACHFYVDNNILMMYIGGVEISAKGSDIDVKIARFDKYGKPILSQKIELPDKI